MSVIATLTPAGEQLLAKIVAAYAALRITRVAVGDGIPATSDPVGLTHFVQDIPVSGVTYAGSNATILAQVISGDKQLTITELGVYAQDPDDGEVLLAYMGIDPPETVLPNAGGIYHAKEFSVALLIGRVSGVLANIGSSTFVTRDQLDTLAAQIADKASKSYILAFQLPASGWIGSAAPYVQTVTLSAITESTNALLDYAHSDDEATEGAREKAWACIGYFTQAAGSITAKCRKRKPETDLPVQAMIIG